MNPGGEQSQHLFLFVSITYKTGTRPPGSVVNASTDIYACNRLCRLRCMFYIVLNSGAVPLRSETETSHSVFINIKKFFSLALPHKYVCM